MIGILMCQPYTRWLGAYITDDQPACEEILSYDETYGILRLLALAEQLSLMILAPSFASLGAQPFGR